MTSTGTDSVVNNVQVDCIQAKTNSEMSITFSKVWLECILSGVELRTDFERNSSWLDNILDTIIALLCCERPKNAPSQI